MLVATLLMVLVALAAAFFDGRVYLGHLFLIPEALEERRAAEKAHADQIHALEDRVSRLRDHIGAMEAEQRREHEQAEQESRFAAEEQRLLREQTRQAEIEKVRRERDRLARELQLRPAPPGAADDGDLRVEVTEGALSGFQISVNRQLNHKERRNYRSRFVAGCGVNAVVLDVGPGFIIFSEECEPWTFAGPEFVVEPLTGEYAADSRRRE